MPLQLYAVVALFAVANTGLLNLVMGSRLLYGLASQGLLPKSLAVVHARTRTPHRAIGVMFLAAVFLAWSGTIAHLAGTTSFLLLMVFAAVNLSLVIIRGREAPRRLGGVVARGRALVGAISCVLLLTFLPWRSLLTGGLLLLLGAGAVGMPAYWRRPRP